MRRIGLTGNIASGKSTVAQRWREHGATVIDADELARAAVAPGSAGLRRIVERFGEEILREGELDRARLRALVFADPAERAALEAIVHPEVQRLRRRAERAAVENGAAIVVHEIPLLFEVGLEPEFDVIVVVDSPEDVRVGRLVQRRGISEDEARRMVASQLPAEQKRMRATHVIRNVGTVADLEAAADALWLRLTKEPS
jgi:dephospho-CoA kinase